MSITGMLRQTIYVASVVSTDSYGKNTYETPRPIAARVETRRMMVRNARGEESASNYRIYTAVPVLLTDRLWVPGQDSTNPELSNAPINIEASPDLTGRRVLYRIDT